jgi:hypothetical protein
MPCARPISYIAEVFLELALVHEVAGVEDELGWIAFRSSITASKSAMPRCRRRDDCRRSRARASGRCVSLICAK